MLDVAIHSSWSQQGGSLLASTEKKRKHQGSRRRKTEPPEVTLWYCCFCGHGSMTHKVPACDICNRARCSLCILERVPVSRKEKKQALYTWTQNAALRSEAALLDLTTTEPDLPVLQPPDLRTATRIVTCTTSKPGPTPSQLSSQQELHSITTPTHVTRQSLNVPDAHSHRDTQSPPTVRNGMEFGLSSLSQVNAAGIIQDPSSLVCSVSDRIPDWTSSPPHQPDTVDTIIAIWRAEDNITSRGSSSPTNSGAANNGKPRNSTAPKQSRKRTSDQSNPPKQSGAKKPKVSKAEATPTGKEDRRPFACPFWKKDPIKYRNCFKGFTRISDVKQDLRRHHRRPHFCRRCGMEFGDQEGKFTEHSRADPQCGNRDFLIPDGMTSDQETALRGYSDRTASEEEQWYVIWGYLFPGGPNGEPPPPRPASPYVDQDLSEDMSSFREFSHREGWRTLANDPDPDLCDVALHIDEEMLQRCLDRIYDAWLAKRSTPSRQSWEQSPLTLSDSSSPDEMDPLNGAAGLDHQFGGDGMMALGEFEAGLDFATNFSGVQIDGFFDNVMAIPNVDGDMTQMFPSIPLLTFDPDIDQMKEVATMDPALISR